MCLCLQNQCSEITVQALDGLLKFVLAEEDTMRDSAARGAGFEISAGGSSRASSNAASISALDPVVILRNLIRLSIENSRKTAAATTTPAATEEKKTSPPPKPKADDSSMDLTADSGVKSALGDDVLLELPSSQ